MRACALMYYRLRQPLNPEFTGRDNGAVSTEAEGRVH